jgi:DNA-3-methyladenine glycosylase
VRDDERSGRTIEVETYCGAEDPAAHTFRGLTKRNRCMFGPAGHSHVHFTYGMHWCCDTVCGAEGQGWGVLVRAVAPIAGIEQMHIAKPSARNDRELANGPAKLTQSFGIEGSFDGAYIIIGDQELTVHDDATLSGAALIGIRAVGGGVADHGDQHHDVVFEKR